MSVFALSNVGEKFYMFVNTKTKYSLKFEISDYITSQFVGISFIVIRTASF